MLRVPGEGLERRDSELTDSSSQPESGPGGGGRERRLAGRRDKWKERLNTDLLRAIFKGESLERVLNLLEAGASPSACCRGSQISGLHLATLRGSAATLEVLLSAGGQPGARDRAGRLPLHLAAARGRLDCLRLLLAVPSVGELVNARILPGGPSEPPPEGSLDSWNHDHTQFECLMEEEAGKGGETALHLASEQGDWESVKLLLEHGAEASVRDDSGLSPLDVAGRRPREDFQGRRGSAVEAGLRIPVSAKDGPGEEEEEQVRGEEAIGPVQRVCSLLVTSGADFTKAKVIVKDGLVINQRRMKTTALHSAVEARDQGLVGFLLTQGACPLTWDERGQTAVHLAVLRESESCLRALLNSGGEGVVDARDVEGRTPLLAAVEQGWPDGVALLLEAGGGLLDSTNTNQTALHLAAARGHRTILQELLSIPEILKILERTNGSHETALCSAVRGGHLESTKLLCRAGADPQFLLLPGDQSLLHLAVLGQSLQILRVLLAEGARPRIDLPTRENKLTPLHIAASEGYLDCAEELLSAGADLRSRNKTGDTALHLAARSGHSELVLCLLRADPGQVSLRNSQGWTALHVAASQENATSARALIQCGSDLSALLRSELGDRTAVDIICASIPNAGEFLESCLNDFVHVDAPLNEPNCQISIDFDIFMPQDNCKQMKVIGAIMNCHRQTVKDKIMLHPLIECFLYLKWQQFKQFFLFTMLLYFILTVSLTTVSHLTFVEHNTTNVYKTISIIGRGVLFIVLIPIIFIELANLSQMQRHYFQDYESYVKWSVILLTVGVEALSGIGGYSWIRYLAAVAVLLSWIEMLFLLARLPAWGFYVLMFSRVSLKILKVLATFSFLILGFAFSFLILFEAQVPFRNMIESVVKVIVMMIEFDYEDMFDGRNGSLFSTVGRIMFAFFVLLVAMVMMNLIVGVAVSDITRLEEQGRTQQLSKQAAFLSFLEEFGSTRFLPGSAKASWPAGQRHLPRTLLITPAKPSTSQVKLPRGHLENLLFHLKTRTVPRQNSLGVSDSLEEICRGIDRVAEGLRNLEEERRAASPFYRRSKDMDQLLKMILDEQRSIREHLQKRDTRGNWDFRGDKERQFNI